MGLFAINKETSTSDGASIHQMGSPNQNFGLSKNEFDNLVVKLKEGDESFFETVFLSHFEDCILYLVKNSSVDYEIAYDYTMDTLIAFRQKLLTDKIGYGNLRFLFTKMATQLASKGNAKENKLKDIFLEEYEEENDFDDKVEALKKAWADLSQEDQKLLENFYYLDIPLNKIAEVENKSDAALRKQKQRAVDKLRSIFFNNYNN